MKPITIQLNPLKKVGIIHLIPEEDINSRISKIKPISFRTFRGYVEKAQCTKILKQQLKEAREVNNGILKGSLEDDFKTTLNELTTWTLTKMTYEKY